MTIMRHITVSVIFTTPVCTTFTSAFAHNCVQQAFHFLFSASTFGMVPCICLISHSLKMFFICIICPCSFVTYQCFFHKRYLSASTVSFHNYLYTCFIGKISYFPLSSKSTDGITLCQFMCCRDKEGCSSFKVLYNLVYRDVLPCSCSSSKV